MNYGRLAIAAVVATIVDAVYGFIVYGNLLTSQFAMYPGVYRPMDAQASYMPALFGGILVAMFAASFIYAKGYEGGSGFEEGARFGVAIGLFAVGYAVLVAYATTNIGRRMTLMMACAALVEWIIAGIVIGLIYKKRGV
ncbi:MAG TPA: DUF1761 family protein [Vicinamibacterales bacterium]|jgi:hypothetical protein